MSDVALSSPLNIGKVQLRNRVALAPMAGLPTYLSHSAWRFGAGHMVSKWWPPSWSCGIRKRANCGALIAGSAPMAVQMAGNEASVMAETARRLTGEGAALIDINFGARLRRCAVAAGSTIG